MPYSPIPTLQRKRIPAVFMRAGTSRGLFFKLEHLPESRKDWAEIISKAMGSPDPFSRQLDGMGAGTSTTSKVAVVSKSGDPRADVDYLFIQGEWSNHIRLTLTATHSSIRPILFSQYPSAGVTSTSTEIVVT
jgi:hypothetical protein